MNFDQSIPFALRIKHVAAISVKMVIVAQVLTILFRLLMFTALTIEKDGARLFLVAIVLLIDQKFTNDVIIVDSFFKSKGHAKLLRRLKSVDLLLEQHINIHVEYTDQMHQHARRFICYTVLCLLWSIGLFIGFANIIFSGQYSTGSMGEQIFTFCYIIRNAFFRNCEHQNFLIIDSQMLTFSPIPFQ